MILLDTNVFVWLVSGERPLGPRSNAAIRQANDGTALRISAISPWEISMLVEKGRISLGMDTMGWVETALMHAAISLEPVNPVIAVDAGQLPGKIHGDPADRIIIATARFLNCPLLTTDRKILTYATQGKVEALDARL